MKKNIGNTDKLIRYAVSIGLLSLFSFGIVEGTIGLVVIGVAFVLAITGLLGLCPAYFPFGMSTCKRKNEEDKGE